jgi:protein Tex
MGEEEPSSISVPEEINTTEIHSKIANSLSIPQKTIDVALDLLLNGNTVPFVARYRKEATNSLDEIQLRNIKKNYESLISIEERKISVLKLILAQNKLTQPLLDEILNATTLQDVEDLYLPYKIKHKTLGAKAREKGLQPLADLIRSGVKDGEIAEVIAQFINPEKGVESEKDALSGAVDIIAEEVGSDPEARKITREVVFQRAVINTEVNEEVLNGTAKIFSKEGKEIDPSTFEMYYEFKIEGTQMKNHQILAINRADNLDVIDVDLITPDDELIPEIKKMQINKQSAKTNKLLEYYERAVEQGYKRYIIRAIKREMWNNLREEAETHAISVFARNLSNLLMTPALKNKAIVGVDPGYRTGCKVAVIDKYGDYLEDSVIYPHAPKNRVKEAKDILLSLAKKHNAFTFAIGNGTASRETEQIVADMIKKNRTDKFPLEYAIVSEAGASIYSASDLAIEEFPDLDLTVRGAISIARRLQNPISELIKIDPKSIGVGMYQHDVNQTELRAELDTVIESCVNSVGVDLNSASSKLLEYVSGLSKKTSKKIVEYRKENGPFTNRNQLKKVKGLGAKTFEQCAGFMHIRNAENPLDTTFIHPESYKLVKTLLKMYKLDLSQIIDSKQRDIVDKKLDAIDIKATCKKLSVEPEFLKDIIDQLKKPTFDPREELDAPILRQDVLSIDDLEENMIVKGTVRNVVDFGAFCDIGVKINGLVHKSQIANQYVKDVHKFLAVGDVKDFRILKIDKEKKRIQLSLKQVIQS